MRRAFVPILIGLLAAGCGGGSSGDRLSKEAWIAKADHICNTYADKTDFSAHPNSFSDVASLANRMQTAVSNLHQDIRALGLPSSDKQAVQSWLQQLTQVELDIKEMRDKAKASDAAGVKAASVQATGDLASARRSAKDLGMKDCSN